MDSSLPTSEPPRILSSPIPEDVTLAPLPDADPSPKDPSSVLVFERHTRPATCEILTRTVRRLHSPEAARDFARVEIPLDPSEEKITFHHLHVIRDGQTHAAIKASAFRSGGAEDRLSAVAHLEDIRPGDILDLAFTTRPHVPDFEGKSFFHYTLGTPWPVGEAILTATLPAASHLVLGKSGLGSEPRREKLADGGERLVWHLRNPKPSPIDPTIPSWHLPAPYAQGSDFADWNEVASRVYRLWAPVLQRAGHSPALADIVGELKKFGTAPATFADAAIRFVQDEILPLAEDSNGFTFLPKNPESVLTGRVGDSRDKALLLCALLRAEGITAWPVLVNSVLQHSIAGFLPSPGAFDHVIVCIRLDKQYSWVDPAVPVQGGTMETRILPRYVHGLIVHPKSKALVKLPKPTPNSGEIQVRDDYTIDYGRKSARLVSTRIAFGTRADSLRQTLVRTGQKELESAFLRSIQHVFPGAAHESPLSIEDDREANGITIHETFRIPGFISTRSGSGRVIARFPGHAITDHLATTSEAKRAHPLDLPFPNLVTHLITANLPHGLQLEKTRDTIEGPGFVFTNAMRPNQEGLEIRNTYTATANRVEPSDLAVYTSKIHRVLEALEVSIPIPHVSLARKNRIVLGLAAIAAVVAMIGLIVNVILGDSGDQRTDFDPLDDEPTTLGVIDKPVEDEIILFDQTLKTGISDILNDPGTVDLGGPSLDDAREFDFSLDPSAKDKTHKRREGLPSLLK